MGSSCTLWIGSDSPFCDTDVLNEVRNSGEHPEWNIALDLILRLVKIPLDTISLELFWTTYRETIRNKDEERDLLLQFIDTYPGNLVSYLGANSLIGDILHAKCGFGLADGSATRDQIIEWFRYTAENGHSDIMRLLLEDRRSDPRICSPYRLSVSAPSKGSKHRLLISAPLHPCIGSEHMF